VLRGGDLVDEEHRKDAEEILLRELAEYEKLKQKVIMT